MLKLNIRYTTLGTLILLLGFVLLFVGTKVFADNSNAPALQVINPGEDNVPDAPAANTVYYAYLVPWEWRTSVTGEIDDKSTETREFHHWAIKYDGAKGIIDLRSVPRRTCNPDLVRCAITGWAIAVYDQIITGPLDVRYLTTWQNNKSGVLQNLNNADASFLVCGLNDALPGDTLNEFVKSLFIYCSDPTGNQSFKPLVPNEQSNYHANLGVIRLFNDRVGESSNEWTLAKAVFQADYERIIRDQGIEIALKRAGYWERKYGFDVRSIEQKQRDGETVKPQTTQTDDFDCADSDTMGCDLSWTEVLADWDIVSNYATKTLNTDGRARADASVSGDDHTAAVDCDNLPSFDWCGVVVRFDSSSDTGYYYVRRNDNTSHIIYSVSTGTPTQISSCAGSDYLGGTVDIDIALTIDGSDLEAFSEGVSECTVTDSGITGNDMCGLYGYDVSVNYNNFSCEDLGGTPAVRNRISVTIH